MRNLYIKINNKNFIDLLGTEIKEEGNYPFAFCIIDIDYRDYVKKGDKVTVYENDEELVSGEIEYTNVPEYIDPYSLEESDMLFTEIKLVNLTRYGYPVGFKYISKVYNELSKLNNCIEPYTEASYIPEEEPEDNDYDERASFIYKIKFYMSAYHMITATKRQRTYKEHGDVGYIYNECYIYNYISNVIGDAPP